MIISTTPLLCFIVCLLNKYIIHKLSGVVNKSMSINEDKLLASNAIFRKIAYFGRNPFPVFLPKCLLVTCPQTPEIITCGDGCASRWNAEIFIHKDRKRKNLIIAIVKWNGGLDFLKPPSVKCNRSVGKELLSNVFLFHRQVDTIGY